MNKLITRRTFLGQLAGSLLLLGCGLPRKTAWVSPGSAKGSLRLVFYTDVHARVEWDTPLALEKATRTINAAGADIVIAGGDLITDGFQSSAGVVSPRWDAYMKMHRAIKADLYPAIGNHDLVAVIPEDGSAPAADPRSDFLFRTGLDRTWYSFDAVGYHFVVLDSILVGGNGYPYQGFIIPEQMSWLKRDLAKIPPGTPVVVVTHIPLLSSFFVATEGADRTAPEGRMVANNLEVLETLDEYNVVLVLQGHLHVKELIKWKNITFITGGAVCGKWWRGPWHKTEEGFNFITLTGNHVTWEYIDYGWMARRP